MSQDSPEDSAALANAERVRRTLMEITDDFRQKYSRCTVEQMCRGIYALLPTGGYGAIFAGNVAEIQDSTGRASCIPRICRYTVKSYPALDELVYTSASKTVDIRTSEIYSYRRRTALR